MRLFPYERASQLMEEAKIDVLLAHTPSNVSYLADYYSHFITPSFILDDGSALYISFVGLPREKDREPFFTPCTGEGEDLIVKELWIKDRRFYGAQSPLASYLGKEEPQIKADRAVDCVAEALLERELEGSTIGVEMMQLPLGIFRELEKKMPKAQFKDGTDVLWQLRVIKSEEELVRLQRAARMTEKAIKTAFDNLTEGMSELEFERILRITLAESGGDWVWNHVAFGPRGVSCPTPTTLRRGEAARVDLGGSYQGYICDMSRVALLGKPNQKTTRVCSAVLQTSKAVKNEVKPGVKCSHLYDLATYEIQKHGYQLYVPAAGHGVGRDVHEPPFLTKSSDAPLAPGMVITVEIEVRARDVGIINIEDEILITDKGYSPITCSDQNLYLRP